MGSTVSQLICRCSAIAFRDRCNDNHTAVSSKLRVNPDLCRARGTCCITTPCSGQLTLEASASMKIIVPAPKSGARHLRGPFPWSKREHFRPQTPHRHWAFFQGLARMTICSPTDVTSNSTFSITMLLTPTNFFAKLETVTGLHSCPWFLDNFKYNMWSPVALCFLQLLLFPTHTF